MSDRVELRWPGKYDAQGRRTPVPRAGVRLRRLEQFTVEDTTAHAWCNRLILGDNLLALDGLLNDHAGQVDLVYIDPPFATGSSFEVATRVGPARGGKRAELRQPAYGDSWPGGMGGFLAMLDLRLRLIHTLLAPHGSLYIHVDPTVGHAVKLLLDEVFGPAGFQREIIWRIGWVSGFKTRARNWIRNHDLIFFYVKDPSQFTFNKHYVPHPEGYRRRDGAPPKAPGVPIDDVWNASEAEQALRGPESLDSIQIKSFSTEKTGYATQKNESLLRRIIEASSNPGDLVADLFCGSGTTLTVAEQLGRRWLGCDTGRAAVQICRQRLLSQPRAQPFEVLEVLAEEHQRWVDNLKAQDTELAERAAVLEHLSTDLSQEGAKIIVVPGGQAATDEDVKAAAKHARAAEVNSVQVVAWDWVRTGSVWIHAGQTYVGERAKANANSLTVSGWSLTRELLDPHAGQTVATAVVERPRLCVTLSGLDQAAVEVELAGYRDQHPERWPPGLAALVHDPLDLIEMWAVTWDDDERQSVDQTWLRTGRARSLTPSSGQHRYPTQAPGPFVLVVRTWDVLARRMVLRCALGRDPAGGLKVERVWIEGPRS